MRHFLTIVAITALVSPPAHAQPSDRLDDAQLNLPQVEAIDFTWSGHRVNAQMVQRGGHQFIIYYDASRQMTVAHRENLRTPWRYHKLPSFVGWDSHNYATVDVDEEGYVHVLGNMHNDALVYFRSREPWNVRTLEPIESMISREREQNVTYPVFMHDNEGRLIAIYRLGGSGNGRYYFHRYDVATQSWSLLHNGQIFDGEDERGAYYVGPIEGPDGMFHTIWVWRETPSAATNNNLSYVRSPDLESWEDSNGNPVVLPIVRSTGEIVDPIPVFNGLLNGQQRLGFDADGLPMISYYKHDANGDTQIMMARKEGEGWGIYQLTNWTDSAQNLDRGGSLTVSITVQEPPYVAEDGTIRVRASRDGEALEYIVDPDSNATIGLQPYDAFPEVIRVFQENPELVQHIRRAQGIPEDSRYDFYLSWEANQTNQDQARATIPEPSILRVHQIPRP